MASVPKSNKTMKLLVPPLKPGKKPEQTSRQGQRRLDRTEERAAARSTFAPAPAQADLSVAEVDGYTKAKQGLDFLQLLWPVRIDAPRAFRWGAWGAISTLPKQTPEALAELLRPVAEAIDAAQNAVRSYEARVNVPRDFVRPSPLSLTLPDNFGALVRAAVAKSGGQPAELLARFERVASSWDERHAHPGASHTAPQPYHRETEAERLAKLAGVDLARFPDAIVLEAKAAWDRGQREVGSSSAGVRRSYASEGAFIFNYVQAKGLFGALPTR